MCTQSVRAVHAVVEYLKPILPLVIQRSNIVAT